MTKLTQPVSLNGVWKQVAPASASLILTVEHGSDVRVAFADAIGDLAVADGHRMSGAGLSTMSLANTPKPCFAKTTSRSAAGLRVTYF